MTHLLDLLIIIDIESTCWEGDPPVGEESEIIEIGICTYDIARGERVEKESVFVLPETSSISEFCTELTSITPAMVKNKGMPFNEACAMLRKKYKSKDRTWGSWGDYDRAQFERQCIRLGIGYPFGRTHINLKNLFALQNKLTREPGMEHALKLLNLPLEGTHHRAGDDAWNIGGIVEMMLKK
ncbi:MAG: exonuclease domain-containing protein [Candidatus Dojkabacteria bacterium]